jgi:CheY-like chemotaxis protein
MSQQSAPILLESRPGRTAPPSTERSLPPFPVAAPAATGARVLVIDDDEISRSVSSQLLERLGCTVDRAPGDLEALERIRGTRYDIVFMDCQMPVMDGFEATTRILEEYGKNAPPVVALTANTSLKDRERCFATGMSDFVDKPVRRAELVRVLNRWIPGRAAR